jgi:hypothetical protein
MELVVKPTVVTQLHQEITDDDVSAASLRNYVNSWLQHKASEVAYPTLAFYRNALNRFLAFLFLGGVVDAGLPQITCRHIMRFRNEEAKWFARKTVNREVTLLRLMFRAAKRDALVADNPAEFVATIRSGVLSNEFADALVAGLREKNAHRKNDDVGSGRRQVTFGSRDYSAFVCGGDYWVIIYQGQAAILRATLGLYCLGCLLRHPRREFHVRELLAAHIEIRVPAFVDGLREAGGLEQRIGDPRRYGANSRCTSQGRIQAPDRRSAERPGGGGTV